jgi:twitching motility protein PilT
MADIQEFLKIMIEKGASDLHVAVNSPPLVRVDGDLSPLPYPPLTPTDTKNLTYSLLTEAQKHRFEEELELDFSFAVRGLARFRGNLFLQKGSVGGAFRALQNSKLSRARPAADRERAVQAAERSRAGHRTDR